MADVIPIMTSNSAPSGTVSASGADSTYDAYKAMDDDNATYWSHTSAGPWNLQYSWNEPHAKLVTGFTIRARAGAGNQDGAPKTFKLQGYNGETGAYTDLNAPADQTAWGDGEQRTFNFVNTTTYQAYRLYITANNGGSATEVAEFELLGGASSAQISLAGIDVICKQPLAQIQLAGIDVVCKQPLAQIQLAGILSLWDTKVTLTVTIVGAGSVTLDPVGGVYEIDSDVIMTASADSGYTFRRWEGDATGSVNPKTITMDSNKEVTAVFEIYVPSDVGLMMGFHF